MNLRVSPRRRWLWLGTWKGEALRLSGSLSAWLGLGGPGAVSDVVPYARMKYYFSKRRRDSLCAAACTYATAHSRVSDFRSAAGRDLTGRANIGRAKRNSLELPPVDDSPCTIAVLPRARL